MIIRSSKSSVTSSSRFFNSFNLLTKVQSIHEINSITKRDQAFGGIRGGQPNHLEIYIQKQRRRDSTDRVHHRVNHY